MRILFPLFLLAVVVGASGCRFQKLRKSDDWKAKFDAAEEYMAEGDCYRAQILLEDIVPLLRGNELGEDALFMLAESHFCQRQYILSASRYMSFYNTYGRSDKVEDAMYKEALSYYMQSPRYSLDQAETYDAILKAQLYLNRHPYGKYREECADIIDELQEKLEKKAFEIAKEYSKIRYYKSAVVAFEAFADDYPDSHFLEEADYLKIEAQYNYAEGSVLDKQKERYTQVVDFYLDYIDKYPESKYLGKLEGYYSASLEALQSLRKTAEDRS